MELKFEKINFHPPNSIYLFSSYLIASNSGSAPLVFSLFIIRWFAQRFTLNCNPLKLK